MSARCARCLTLCVALQLAHGHLLHRRPTASLPALPFCPSPSSLSPRAAHPTASAPLPAAPPTPPASTFDWFAHWYPVDVLSTLDPSRPHSMQLLGLQLAVWNDGPTLHGKKQPGEWHAFADACPHRLAPLSEGRVEADGSLLCSYHGWRFAADGACASLPYSPPRLAERQRCSPRAACTSYPTRAADGFLWVFPRAGAAGRAQAEAAALPRLAELHDPALAGRYAWRIPAGVRDFPCGWDGMVENTLDPAHFCAAHHGTLGNRYTDPAPYAFDAARPLDAEAGFAVRGDFGALEFTPPCLVKYTPDYAGMPFNGSLVLATYCVPTRPGWVRPLANVIADKAHVSRGTLAERALALFMAGWLPAWVGHVGSSVVLHQDAGLLYKQYRNLRERGYNAVPRAGVRYDELVFCPTSVDKGVLAFREWLRLHAGGGVPWACEDELPPRGTEDIYDMWEAHTRQCRYCQAAYRNLQAAKYASLALCGGAVLFLPDGGERSAVALLALLAAAAIHRVTRLFVRYEYSHAEND
ncbi:hypothetical protein AB1Y20_005739 [Prymnesium parvum]|uniref:Rieske domain-containing protein n=1 Tax=Prymnesium parvum TaxID=97485 RepID=A0AB34J2P9_PRYPA